MAEDVTKVIGGCLKPCHYKQYKFVGEKGLTSLKKNSSLTMILWAVNYDISVETEKLVYPLTSFVGDIGGTLGLFVGFSFMMVWDGMESVWEWRFTLQQLCIRKSIDANE